MKKFFSLLLCICLIALMSTSSFAQINIEVSNVEDRVSIQGKSDQINKATSIVINDSYGKAFIDQTRTNDLGEFSFETILKQNMNYRGHVIADGEREEFSFKLEKLILKKTNKDKLGEILSGLMEKTKSKSKLSFREVLALNVMGESFQGEFEAKTKIQAPTDYVNNIFGYGKSAKSSEFAKKLADSQDESGYFAVGDKLIYQKSNQLAWAMIALDYAGQEYDREKSAEILASKQKNDGSFGDVDLTAIAIIALEGDQKSKPALAKAKQFLMSNKKTIINNGNACTLSSVIQALTALGENPSSPKWSDGDNNLFNSLVAKYEGGSFGNQLSDEESLLALIDLNKDESMFSEKRLQSSWKNALFVAFVKKSDDGGSSTPTEETDKVYITVKGLNDNDMVSRQEVEIGSCRTVKDLLTSVLDSRGISYSFNGAGNYLISIGELSEKATINGKYYPLSGWKYHVDGLETQNTMDSYELTKDLEIKVFFLTNYVEDSSSEITDEKPVVAPDIKGKELSKEDKEKISDSLKELAKKGSKKEFNKQVEKLVENIKENNKVELKEIVKDDKHTFKLSKKAIEESVKNTKESIKFLEEVYKDIGKKELMADEKTVIKREVVVKAQAEEKKIAKTEVELDRDALSMIKDNNLDLVVEYKDVNLKISPDFIKKDLVNQDIRINLESVKELSTEVKESKNEQISPVGKTYDFTMENGSDKNVHNFKEYLEVTMSIEDLNLNLMDPDHLGIYYLNENTDSWEFVGGELDKEAKTISFKTNHFSIYSVMEYNKTFDDTKVHWAKAEIEDLASARVCSGISDNLFDPDRKITRAEFASLIVKALKIKEEQYAFGFSDIQSGQWYANAVQTCVNKNFFREKNGEFRPNEPITREEMSYVIAEFMSYQEYSEAHGAKFDQSKYTDYNMISDWAKESLKEVNSLGIINGMTENTLNPKASTTRAQAIVVLKRVMDLLDNR